MNKIPYDGFNPLQNIAAWLVNQGVIRDPALAVVAGGSILLLSLVLVVGAITSFLEGRTNE